ncbi:SDR family oxidoreductase [Actinocorallia sp. A-T 12471]|uniref:SDR family oxidoreductase n=1 Tax=Actinocorallia sp. A-T 12471 TaxID=3089813 RepID=UPI0029D25A7F|nr:SDR family oxidoreductase [Actinocorallia sp. A-T 12471]MDX6744978.1 SDR family oxidoreductase [Actinocorallia sp. A-T 12471]
MTTYGVTGATGHLGGLTVRALLARGVPPADVVALVRTPAKAADLAELGVTVREADYTKPETLPTALAGIDRLVLVSGDIPGQRLQGHRNVVDAAKTAGVSRIAYTSVLRADSTQIALAPDHLATEDYIRNAGLPYVFLRNGWYVEVYTANKVPSALKTGEIVGATGDRPASAAARADYAEAAAAAVTGGVENVVYELGGKPFTLSEFAKALSDETGNEVVYRDISVEELTAELKAAGLDEGTAAFVASLDEAQSRGELYTDSADLADLLGREPTPFVEVLRKEL